MGNYKEYVITLPLSFLMNSDHPVCQDFEDIPDENKEQALLDVFDGLLELANENGSFCIMDRVRA